MLIPSQYLAGATGLEPATSGVTGRRSNQLNYAPNLISDFRLLISDLNSSIRIPQSAIEW